MIWHPIFPQSAEAIGSKFLMPQHPHFLGKVKLSLLIHVKVCPYLFPIASNINIYIHSTFHVKNHYNAYIYVHIYFIYLVWGINGTYNYEPFPSPRDLYYLPQDKN